MKPTAINLPEAATIQFTPRQWDYIDHRLRAESLDEALLDNEEQQSFTEEMVWESQNRLSDTGPTVTILTEVDREVIVDCCLDTVWVDQATCHGNWTPQAETAANKVRDNAIAKVEEALEIIIGRYDWRKA